MESRTIPPHSLELDPNDAETSIAPDSEESTAEAPAMEREPFHFQQSFSGTMEMYGNAQTVQQYLDAHRGWFERCAQPMRVEPLGESGYVLIVGRFGAFGYEVEPKMAVELQPQLGGYRMRSIEIPNYVPPGYRVDYRAQLQLLERETASAKEAAIAPVMTLVNWELDLGVEIYFPGFIYRLPQKVIRRTGDRVLSQIVRQVSRRLTRRVQEDFHSRRELPIPSN